MSEYTETANDSPEACSPDTVAEAAPEVSTIETSGSDNNPWAIRQLPHAPTVSATAASTGPALDPLRADAFCGGARVWPD
ncbi:hypothetical protein [Rhabdochromatium marinum]|uniref:hypothetical protein n=1 Tax=Rhabdochromatium marinum TaxID=48729 RepID=UPI0019079943|nr:hypothetical protein [Rhabdochromatium marinum]